MVEGTFLISKRQLLKNTSVLQHYKFFFFPNLTIILSERKGLEFERQIKKKYKMDLESPNGMNNGKHEY